MNCADIESFKSELEKGLMKYMAIKVDNRSAEAVDSMVKCWTHITEMQNMIKKDFEFTPEKAEKWTSNMVNEDGTKGAHWNIEQTNQFKPQGIEDYVWNATLNMVYSDYYSVAVNNNVNTPEFYVGLAKAFLFDKDALSPKKKIAAYYNCIVDTK